MRLSRSEVLSSNEIEKIDSASKEILEETGVKVLSKGVLDIYKKGGAKVDYENKIVKIPEKIVDECIESAPSEYKLYGRDGDNFLNFGKNLGYSASGHNAIYILDTKTMERRPSTKEEVGNFAKISDALSNIHIVGVQAMPQDVFSKSSILHAVDVVLNNTSKHIFFSPENVNEAKVLIKMLKVISGEEDLAKSPVATCQLSPISPLTWSEGTAEAVVEIAKSGIPLCILPQPYCGVTSPITLAGTLTSNNVEEISALVLAQIVNEGSPFMYGEAWTTFEMNKGTVLIGTPERNLLSVAGAQIARYYSLPSHCIAFDTDANIYDEQNGFEKIFTVIATLQSGINLIVNAGMFSTGMTVSYEQLIVDHEIATFVYRYLEGITVNRDTIAKEVIEKVGQHKDYMMQPHTLKYIHSGEHASYKVSNRDVYDIWKSSGKPSIIDNARKVAEEIIKEYEPKPLSKDKKDKLKDIIASYESGFGK
jgi:trimethylamine--corrinoid protein Co-methyltransferase